MARKRQKIDFLKKDLEEYIKTARKNDSYLFRISNGMKAGNSSESFLLSENFIVFRYYKDPKSISVKAFAYGLSKKNKKAISSCNPMSRNSKDQVVGVTIDNGIEKLNYKIISSEPEVGYYTNIKLISNKFQYLFNSLNAGR